MQDNTKLCPSCTILNFNMLKLNGKTTFTVVKRTYEKAASKRYSDVFEYGESRSEYRNEQTNLPTTKHNAAPICRLQFSNVMLNEM